MSIAMVQCKEEVQLKRETRLQSESSSTRNSLSESSHETLDINVDVGVMQDFALEVLLLRSVGLRKKKPRRGPNDVSVSRIAITLLLH